MFYQVLRPLKNSKPKRRKHTSGTRVFRQTRPCPLCAVVKHESTIPFDSSIDIGDALNGGGSEHQHQRWAKTGQWSGIVVQGSWSGRSLEKHGKTETHLKEPTQRQLQMEPES